MRWWMGYSLNINIKGETDSAVACAELYGNPAFYGYEQGHVCNYNNFWLDDVACSGVELKLEECNHLTWG